MDSSEVVVVFVVVHVALINVSSIDGTRCGSSRRHRSIGSGGVAGGQGLNVVLLALVLIVVVFG